MKSAVKEDVKVTNNIKQLEVQLGATYEYKAKEVQIRSREK